MRCSYTIDTYVTAATAKAVALLLEEATPSTVHIDTSAGVRVEAEPLEYATGEDWAAYVVRKGDGGDPDVTDGALTCVRVKRSTGPGITINDGQGVGRVIRSGLD